MMSKPATQTWPIFTVNKQKEDTKNKPGRHFGPKKKPLKIDLLQESRFKNKWRKEAREKNGSAGKSISKTSKQVSCKRYMIS